LISNFLDFAFWPRPSFHIEPATIAWSHIHDIHKSINASRQSVLIQSTDFVIWNSTNVRYLERSTKWQAGKTITIMPRVLHFPQIPGTESSNTNYQPRLQVVDIRRIARVISTVDFPVDDKSFSES
jgi:hypothetical protein